MPYKFSSVSLVVLLSRYPIPRVIYRCFSCTMLLCVNNRQSSQCFVWKKRISKQIQHYNSCFTGIWIAHFQWLRNRFIDGHINERKMNLVILLLIFGDIANLVILPFNNDIHLVIQSRCHGCLGNSDHQRHLLQERQTLQTYSALILLCYRLQCWRDHLESIIWFRCWKRREGTSYI